MKITVKCVNSIEKTGFYHHQFEMFLEECGAEYGGIAYFSAVRWLSIVVMQRQFFSLRKEITEFMYSKNQLVSELQCCQ